MNLGEQIPRGLPRGGSLTSITIPNSVTSIGEKAFDNNSWTYGNRNRINHIIIGSNLNLSKHPIGNNFSGFYNVNGKKGGVYTYNSNNYRWSYSSQ